MRYEYPGYMPDNYRVWDVDKMYVISNGYSIVSAYAGKEPFLTVQKNHTPVREKDFMQAVGKVNNRYFYERDILAYTTESTMGKGVVQYCPSKMAWAIYDKEKDEYVLLCNCKRLKVLGNVYQNKELLNVKTAETPKTKPADQKKPVAYEKPTANAKPVTKENAPAQNVPKNNTNTKKKEPSFKETEALANTLGTAHVYCGYSVVNGTPTWKYKLVTAGKSVSDTKAFKNKGDNLHYMIGCVVIALSKLKKPANIILHTPYEVINSMINAKTLDEWERNGWRKADGSAPTHVEDLQNLHSVLSKLSFANISAEIIKQ